MRNFRTENPPKHDLVYQSLVKLIRTGKLLSGQMLPRENELAHRLNVSRNSVRRGLLRLQQQGLIITRQGSGTFVASTAPPPAPSSRITSIAMVTTDALPIWQNMDLIAGVNERAASLGWRIMNCAADSASILVDVLRANPSQTRFCGAVSIGRGIGQGDGPSQRLMRRLPDDVPCVFIDGTPGDQAASHILIDHEFGAFHAVSFLLKLGHRRILFLSEEPQSWKNELRLKGYLRAFAAGGIDPGPTQIIKAQAPTKTGSGDWPRTIREAVVRDPNPTALVLENLGRGPYVLDVLQQIGLRVPEDLSLVLFDDDPTLAGLSPGLTCVNYPLIEAGRAAVDVLARIAEGEIHGRGHDPAMPIVLRPELVMRDSVAPPPSDAQQ